jgi:hypothetical protein
MTDVHIPDTNNAPQHTHAGNSTFLDNIIEHSERLTKLELGLDSLGEDLLEEIANVRTQLTDSIAESHDTQRKLLDGKLQQLEDLATKVEQQLAGLIKVPIQGLEEGEPEKAVLLPAEEVESDVSKDIPEAVETVTPVEKPPVSVEKPKKEAYVHLSIHARRKVRRQKAKDEKEGT